MENFLKLKLYISNQPIVLRKTDCAIDIWWNESLTKGCNKIDKISIRLNIFYVRLNLIMDSNVYEDIFF